KRNLASQDIVSLNISYPFQYKTYTMFANMNANYSHYKANFGEGRTIDLKPFAVTVYAQNSLRFAKTWTAELTGFYNSPTVWQGAVKANAMWSVDAGLQKQLFNNKATLKASVSDVFNSMKFKGHTDFAGQKADVDVKWESQQFKLSLNFRFGSNTVKAARQRNTGAEEETKRVQQSNGGMGIGN
ncbi:MAG TPA: outer membrane beta-barrel protein, partial [Flavisolibacter sp.]|nr:outer membrane beta-barrel protein [Flavisolibacter sp.]